jgi:hypothetical protein
MSDRVSHPDISGAVVASGFFAVGFYAVYASLEMTMLGAIFPRAVGGALMALSLSQGVLSLTGRAGQETGEGTYAIGSSFRPFALVAVMVAWAFTFPIVGFLTTSFAASLCLVFIAEHERHGASAILLRIAVVSVMIAVFYWLMVRVLYIPMPRGLLL